MFVEIATFRKPLLLLDYLDPIVIMVERPPLEPVTLSV